VLSLTLETDIRLKDSAAQTTTSDRTVIVLQRYSQSLEVTSDQPSDSEHGIRWPARRSNGKILLPVTVEQCREGLCTESWGTDDDDVSRDDVQDASLTTTSTTSSYHRWAARGTTSQLQQLELRTWNLTGWLTDSVEWAAGVSTEFRPSTTSVVMSMPYSTARTFRLACWPCGHVLPSLHRRPRGSERAPIRVMTLADDAGSSKWRCR